MRSLKAMWTQLRSFAERAVAASRLAAPKRSGCILRDSSASGRAVPNDAVERTVFRQRPRPLNAGVR